MKLKDPICKKEEKLQFIAAPIPLRIKSRKAKTTRKGTKKRTCRSRK